MTKIYIIGAPASGKSTYAKKLSAETGIPFFDLDEIKWENTGGKYYSKKRDKNERIQKLQTLLKINADWICEGVYFRDWILPVIEQADEVIILQPSLWLCQYRLLRRSIRRLLHLEPSKHKESFQSFWGLLSFAQRYDAHFLPLALEKIKKIGTKYRVLTKY